MRLAGLDLGTRTMVCSILDNQANAQILPNGAGELLTPSAVFFDKDGVLVGTEALNAGLLDPKRLIQDAKRELGSDKVLVVGHDGVEYRAIDVVRIKLECVKKDFERTTGDILEEIAISVPANFDDQKKNEVLDAAKRAGIRRVVLLPHEPTAAICGNGAHKRGDGLDLVLDLGGGTFDVTLAEIEGDSIRVKTTNGVAQLGGIDFSTALCEIVLDRFEGKHGFRPNPAEHPLEFGELQQRIEQAKHTLSSRTSAPILLSVAGKALPCEVSRDEFQAKTQPLIDRALSCAERTLHEAGVSAADLTEIMAVGGASQMPAFLEGIESRFGRKASYHGEPQFAVARGALIMGRLEKERLGEPIFIRGQRVPPLRWGLRDVTAHAVGVSLLDDNDVLVNNVLLGKSKPIPSEHTASFRLAEPGQCEALITVLQGPDGAVHEDCLELGKLELSDLEPVTDGPHKIDIRLRIDRNGRLSAEAVDPNCGKRTEMELAYASDAKGGA